MVGIISGNQLGLQQSSASVLGGLGTLGRASVGRMGENAYVNAMTGNLVVTNTDEMLFGVGNDVGVGRAYNSLATTDYDNSDNWQLTLTRRLTNLPSSPYTSGTIKRVAADGSVLTYTWDSTYSAYVNTDGDGPYDTLVHNGTAWVWTDGGSQATETYEADGSVWRLKESKDADGNVMSFTYTSGLLTRVTTATSTHSEYTDLVYSSGNLTQVETHYWDAATSTAKTLTRVRYGYDGSSRMTSVTVDLSPEDNAVTDGKVYTTTYTYDGTSKRVASITQTDGSSISVTYDTSGRVATFVEAVATGESRTATFNYNSSTQTTITQTTTADTVGLSTVLVYNSKGWIGSITPPAPTTGGTAQATEFYYNNNGDITTIIFGTNNRLDYYYDSHGNRVAERNSAGDTLVRTFSTKNELLAETRYAVADADTASSTNYDGQVNGWGTANAPSDPLTSRYAYDSEGHLRFAVSAEGRVSEYLYNTAGQQTSVITYAGHVYDVSALAYNATISESTLAAWAGYLSDKSTALRTDTAYDFRGAVSTVTSFGKTNSDGSGNITDETERTKTYYVYDQAGRLLERRNAASTDPQTYVYDGLGRLIATTDKIETAAGGYVTATTTIDFQDSVNKTLVTLADGVTRLSTYDKAGELVSVVETGAGGSSLTATTSYQYDALGRLRIMTDPSGVKTHVLYDDIGRKVADIQQDGTIVEYRYHAINDQLAVTIRYKTLLTSTKLALLVDGAGKPADIELSALTIATDTADRYEWRIYDKANRLIETVDAAGYATIFTYDAASRLTKVTAYATAISSTTVGNWKTGTAPTTLQTPSSDSTNDRVSRNFYDKAGKLVGTLDAEGYVTQIVSDGAGQTLKTIRFATKTSSTYWASGTFAQLLTSAGTAAADIHNYFVYDQRGLLRAQIDGEGDLTRFHYTALGNLDQEITGQKLTSGQLSGLLTTPPTLATLPTSGSDVLETTDYVRNLYGDVLKEIRWVRNSAGTALISETDVYTYDAMRRVTSVTTAQGTSDQRVLSYRYDARGRLTGVLNGEGSSRLGGGWDYTATGTSGADTLNGTTGKDFIQGAAGGDTIDGLANDDRLEGGDGNDSLQGGTGADAMVGGLGDDSFYVDSTSDVVIETSGQGTDRVYSSISYTLAAAANVETLSTTNDAGTTAINLGGNALANTLIGNAGANALYGYGGDDTLTANGGGDWLIGGTGNDYMTGGSGADVFVFSAGDGADTIADFSIGSDLIDLRAFSGAATITQSGSDAVVTIGSWSVTLLGTTAANLTISSFVYPAATYDQTINGTGSAETLNGGSTKDLIYGLNGNDTINGLGGDDRLEGGAGGDTLNGGDGDDIVLGGASGDTINGDDGNDVLQGEAGDETINGGAGTDVIDGGSGIDTMTGGTGVDYFVFAAGDTGSSGQDVITDFSVGTDILDFTAISGTPTVTQSGSDTIVELGSFSNKVKVKLTGVTASTVTSASFAAAPMAGTAGTAPAAAAAAPDAGPSGASADDTIYATWGTTYAYDDADRLIAKYEANGANASGNRTLYYYTTDGALAYEINALGGVVEYKYNAFGERTDTVVHATAIGTTTLATLTGGLVNSAVTSAVTTNALDGVTTVAYNITGTVASVTDARDSVASYTYNSFREQLTSTTQLNATESRVISQVFDRRGQATSQTVDTTRTTAFVYDAFGRATQVTDAKGAVRSTGYDRAGRVVTSTDALSNVTTYASYDGRGNVTTKTDPLGNTTTYQYDEKKRKITVTTPESIVTVSDLNAYGQTIKVTDGASRTTAYTYDKDGNLKTVKDGLTNTVLTNNYDEDGRLEQVVDARGFVTSYTYDAANRTLTRKVNDGGLNLTTSWAYDAKGQQVSVTDPSGTVTAFEYSKAGDQTKVTVDVGGLAIRTDYTYDKGGRQLSVTEAVGTSAERLTKYFYDRVDKLIQTQIDPSGLNLTTVYTYDKNGNAVAKTDANGKITRYFYDPENRLAYTIDATGAVTKTTYTANGLIASTRAYVGVVASGTLSGWPLEITAESTITGAVSTNGADEVTSYVYDRDNRLRYVIDATLRPVEYIYDGAGNVLRSISYGASIEAGTFTTSYVSGRITALGLAAHAGTRTTRAVFDAANRQIYNVDAEGGVTQFVYDLGGNVVKSIQFLNKYTTAGDPSAADIVAGVATNAADRTSRSLFDGAGRAVYAVDAESYVTEFKYDVDGQVTDQIRYAATYTVTDSTTIATLASAIGTLPSTAQVTKYAYDAAGRLTDTYDPLNVRTRLTLDAMGNVTDIVRAYGHSTDAATTHRVYDAAGRLTSETRAYGASAATTTAWTYNGAGRVLTETRASGVSGEAATTTYTYDAVNRVLTETVQLTSSVNAVTTNQYDAFGNLVKVTDARSGVGFFYYDALNRLVLQVDSEKYVTKTEYSIGNEAAKVTRYATALSTTPSVGTAPTATTNAADAVTTIERDKLDRVVKITDAEGFYEQYTLNAFGDRTQVRNKLAGVTTNVFDKRGLLTQETLPVKSTNSAGTESSTYVVNKYEYDARGNQTKTIEAYGFAEVRTTNFVFDKADRLTSKSGDAVTITNASTFATTTNQTPTETIAYDARGNVIQTIKSDGAKTFFYYDALDRKIAEVDALGSYTVWTYDHRNNAVTTKVYGDVVTLPGTPGGTPPTPVNSSNYRQTTATYDLNNRLLTTSIAGLRVGSYSGSSYSTSAGNTVTTTNVYDASGNLIKQADARGNDTFTYYDKLGRKVAQVDQERYLTSYTLDGEGNVTKEERFATAISGGVTISTSSDPATLRSGVSGNAADRITNFTYDKNGRRLTEQRTGLTYTTVGSTGALTTTTGGSATITYAYNGLGGVTKKTEANGDYVDYTFDALNRQITEKTSAFTDYASASVKRLTEAFYDGLGATTREVVRKDGDTTSANWRVTKYDYVKGRLDTVTDAEGFAHTYGYDIAGRVVKDGYTRVNAAGTSLTEAVQYQYDALGRLTLQRNGSYASGSWSFGDSTQSQYNVYGEVSAKGQNGMWQETFEYDTAGRMWRSNQGDGTSKIFLYDAGGAVTMTIASSGSGDLSTFTTLEGTNTTTAAMAALTTGGALGSVALADYVMTINVNDKRGQSTATREPFRQLTYDLIYTTYTTDTIVHSRAYNAFGEVKSETDARGNTTDFTYNTMGRLIKKESPYVSVTGEDGNSTSARPVEEYYFDASGRMVAVKDANTNINSRALLAGSGFDGSDPIVLAEFHADGQVFRTDVDVFGDVRKLTNELGKVETRDYDKMGRLLVLTRPTRTATSTTLVENYTYDGLGQRLKHWNSQLGSTVVEKTDYDRQGRVSSFTDFGAYTTTYSYAWDASIATSGLATFGGWTKTTVNTAGLTGTEKSDYFGRTVSRVDFGSNTYASTFDKAAHMLTEGTKTLTYYNTGKLKSSSDSWTGSSANFDYTKIATASYGYDLDGNRIIERYDASSFHWVEGHYDGEQQWVEGEWQQNDYVLQDSVATWDALNRMTAFTDASTTPDTTITNQYDAVGNVRHTAATYRRADTGASSSQDYWYKYDSMNRFVTTKGSLSGGVISRGSTGTDIQYDAAGQRVVAITTDYQSSNHREEYSYTEDGYLYQTKMGNGTSPTMVLRSNTVRDAMGRMTSYVEYWDGSDVSYSRTATYNAKSELLTETVMTDESPTSMLSDWKQVTTTYYYGAETSTNSWVFTGAYQGGVVTGSYIDTTHGGANDKREKTAYVWFGDARQATITKDNDANSSTNNEWVSTMHYASDGRLVSADIDDGDPRKVTYNTEVFGQVLSRIEGATDTQGATKNYYYYFDGVQVGATSNRGMAETDYAKTINNRWSPNNNAGNYADFDQSYRAVGAGGSQANASAYTVQDGDTLQAIATKVWGDSSLWYLIADANGLNGTEPLVGGRTLSIPGNARNVHNSAVTFKPYDPNIALGNNAPSRKKPPKPMSGFAMVIVALIAMAVVAIVAPYAIAGMSTMMGASVTAAEVGAAMLAPGGLAASGLVSTQALIAGSALAGAAGSIVSQGFAVATGMQEKFDWKAVGMAAIGSGVSAGLSRLSPFSAPANASRLVNAGYAAANGALSSVITQGVGVATGLQDRFSWSSVAVQAVSAGVGSVVGESLPGDLDPAFRAVVGSWVGGVAGAGAQSLIEGTSFGDNLRAALPGLIANTIGALFASQAARSEEEKLADVMGISADDSVSNAVAIARETVAVWDGDVSRTSEWQANEAAASIELFASGAEARAAEELDPAGASRQLSAAIDRYFERTLQGDSGRAILAQVRENLYGPPPAVASSSEAPASDETETVGEFHATARRLGHGFGLLDRPNVWMGNLEAKIGGDVDRYVSQVPGGRETLQFVGVATMFAGGPTKFAAGQLYNLAEGGLRFEAKQHYADVGYQSNTAEPGGNGLIFLGGIVINGPGAVKGASRMGGFFNGLFGGRRGPSASTPGAVPASPSTSGRVRWVDENAGMDSAARRYNDGAQGARSNPTTQRGQAPTIDRTLPDGSTAPVRFDGQDGNILIDRKRAIVTTPKAKNQALRQSEALEQNGMTGRWEVPNAAQAARANTMLRNLGIKNITVEVVTE